MEWYRRMKIALGSAKGIAYPHEDCESSTHYLVLFVNYNVFCLKRY